MDAIRNAAADVLYGEPPTPVSITLPRYGIEGVPQVRCGAGNVLIFWGGRPLVLDLPLEAECEPKAGLLVA